LLSPTALIELAARTGTDAVALTDHDTVEGVEEAAAAAARIGIGFIPGVEISVSWGDTTLHVVGLNVDPSSAVLRDGLNSIRAGRMERARRIGEALAKLGFEGTFEAALALAHGFMASRGADYHGPGESPWEPGRLPPLHASLTPVWSQWAH
jgi:predicted metal-dependent phosphoesterase TrpH